MSLDPFFNAPVYIQVHAAAATFAVLTGPIALYRQRRDVIHKTLGYVWVVSMFCVAVSSFWIHSFAVIGPFSPLHGLALLTLWSLWNGANHARHRRITAHKAVFRSLYWFGLMIAGLANFLPDRRINQAVFGGNDDLGWIVIGLGAAILIGIAIGGRGGPRGTANRQAA